MRHSTEIELVRRVLAHLRDGGTDRGPAERRVAIADYRDQDRYAAETGATLGRLPLILGHAAQLRRPGDYLAATVLGTPVAVVRRPDGQLSAFVNVCRHRAAQLLADGGGSGLRAIVCPYHAWSYDLTGKLTAIPDQDGSFPSTAPGTRGLVALPVAERHGLIWVSLEPGGSCDIAGFLGGLDDELAAFGFDGFELYRAEQRTWEFNWKTGIEAFLENYHFSTLHKRTTSRIFFNNLTIFDDFSPHIRAVAPKRSIAALADAAPESWELRPHATLLYVLFPNTCLFIEKSHASLLQVYPDGPARSEVRISHIVGQDGLRYREFWDRNIALFQAAVIEDLDMCESMSTGMAARPQDDILFGRNEAGCVAFHDAVDAAMARGGPLAVPERLAVSLGGR
jgi:phenylpropionate dioxygenase-like ring-hydroxylating dioxygenase large terminal subunit